MGNERREPRGAFNGDGEADVEGVGGSWGYLSPLKEEFRRNGAHLGTDVAAHRGGTSGTHGFVFHQKEGDSENLGVTSKISENKEANNIERERVEGTHNLEEVREIENNRNVLDGERDSQKNLEKQDNIGIELTISQEDN